MAIIYNTNIVKSGLVLYLDAANTRSYPGTGSTWFDLSGNENHFTVNANAFSISSDIKSMNFEGSFGMAKRVVAGSLTDLPIFPNATILTFSTIKNSTADWRTLTRATNVSGDHQIIISTGTNTLGMYDVGIGNFVTSSFDISTIPNVYTRFNLLAFKLSNSSPYWSFSYNGPTVSSSITSVNASFNNGFSTIGGYHSQSIDPNVGSQYWGKISFFMYYNRHLSDNEIIQNYNAIRGRYGV